MGNHLNIYSQKGCIGCKSCEGGAASIGRTSLLIFIGVMTAGIGLLILPFFKKCQYCGHNTWMNSHQAPSAPQQWPAPSYWPAGTMQPPHVPQAPATPPYETSQQWQQWQQ